MLGRNSVVGTGAALDGTAALKTAIAQVESTGMAIHAEVCNALHELEERLSRWLLQSCDLLQSDTLPLTQEFLSQMLGVQRSSVPLVAGKLQEAGLVGYRRGHIHVLDVAGLQDSCCECYATINGHFTKLIGWSPIDRRTRQVGH